MADTDKFWTAEDVAQYLPLPKSTGYNRAQDKVLPGFKVGDHWRFRHESILNWIDESENKPSFPIAD